MEIRTDKYGLTPENISNLFRSVDWGSGLTDEQLLQAVENSDHIAVAWENDIPVGIARSMDDGVWSANIDIIAVHAGYHRRGVATAMLDSLLGQLRSVKCITVAPNEKEVFPLYLRKGFRLVPDGSLLQLINFE